jgi:large subunit ribosomal protein L18
LASTSTQIVKVEGYGGNKDSAASVGTAIADAAKAAGISSVVFDRNGFKYHGRVKALAEAAREGGLVF